MFDFNEYTLKVQAMAPSRLRDFYSEFLRDIETEDDPLTKECLEYNFISFWDSDVRQGFI
jgi:hypothetical protein